MDEEIAEQLASHSASEKAQRASATGIAGDAPVEGYVATAVVSSGSGDGEAVPVEEWNYLDNFYKKYNKVLMDKLTIEKEQARLEQENADLQAILKQCVIHYTHSLHSLHSFIHSFIHSFKPSSKHTAAAAMGEKLFDLLLAG